MICYRGEIWIVYDNMCQLMKMKVAKKDLPLPAPYNQAWNFINKAIDTLHVRNHKDKDCQTLLHPRRIQEMHKDLTPNTQAAEVTISRICSILNIATFCTKAKNGNGIARCIAWPILHAKF